MGACYHVVYNIERDLLTKSPEKSDWIYSGRIELNGQVQHQKVRYLFSEDQVSDSIRSCCDDPYESMILNSTIGQRVCKNFVYEYNEALVECMRKNEASKIISFCKNLVDERLCKSIVFTQETIKKMGEIHLDQRSEEESK